MNTHQTSLWTLLERGSDIKTKNQAKVLHARMIRTIWPISVPFYSKILSIYSKFNLLEYALALFNKLDSPQPTKAWKSIVKCYASRGRFSSSVISFIDMKAAGRIPDRNVFPSVLKSCVHLRDLKLGESVHGCIIRLGLDSDLYTGNALMNMYAKLQLSGNDMNVFDEISQRMIGLPNNVMNGGYGLGYNGNERITCVSSEESRKMGSFGMNPVRKVFETMPLRDVVSWNTVIGGQVQSASFKEALVMLREMGNAGLKPDSFTLSTVLPVLTKCADVVKGKEIHGFAMRHGFSGDIFMGSSLIDMYASCTCVEDAYKLFCSLPQHDHVSWNSIIAACVHNGMFDDVLKLFRQMVRVNIRPVEHSFSIIMPACAHLTTQHLGKQLHSYIIRAGYAENIYVASSLVDLYAKCGHIKTARWIFDNMEIQDSVAWTAMIMGYASHGHAADAISLFEKMQMAGGRPNPVVFVAVLTACSHAGLVDEASKYYDHMTKNHGIVPWLEHYNALVDVLGRAGRLEEAYNFICSMHIHPTAAVWSALLSACRVHKNIDLAEKVAGEIFRIDPKNTSAYALLSSMYSNAGRWKEAQKLRAKMRSKGMIKASACSWVEVKNKVHAIVAGDESHPH
ncbi:OLC1v1019680C1 [Oldenlandia corymbosa var. corymbosa]|uniref:OLC1v1019680C1 n=1 Tax=Oldenlandia corymbosa var. corymbosa TaxID=529605 RepID=A0AAV1EES6_OLDCO|nr:OLC1v1019680C1 [Oldenlandia corymbosa var. corymbosa]